MQTIGSRTYTNVALTAIMILLGVIALRPYVAMPRAQAQVPRPSVDQGAFVLDQKPPRVTTNPELEAAAATRQVAASLDKIAAALSEQAAAQREIGRALSKLSAGVGGQGAQ